MNLFNESELTQCWPRAPEPLSLTNLNQFTSFIDSNYARLRSAPRMAAMKIKWWNELSVSQFIHQFLFYCGNDAAVVINQFLNHLLPSSSISLHSIDFRKWWKLNDFINKLKKVIDETNEQEIAKAITHSNQLTEVHSFHFSHFAIECNGNKWMNFRNKLC